ncbi:MAG: hypothetical protein PHR61_00485 [Candidatus Absconditabacteria bacterium]|nr:hypothetical protein [Candidatus Absconditabacteria bacterium]
MFLLKDKLRQVISKKHLTKNMTGVIALNAVRDYFGFTNNPMLLDGSLRFDILFIKTTQQHIKIKIFQEKKELLKKINESLQSVGYDKNIKDIHIKQK